VIASLPVRLIAVGDESITGHLSSYSHRGKTSFGFNSHSSGWERLSEETTDPVPALQRARRLAAWRVASHYFTLTVCTLLMETF